MGNGSSVMDHDRFKDQIFSLVLYHISQQANPDFRFSLKENCTSDNLPAPEKNDYQSLLNCYKITDPQVSAYVNKHILNKEENLARFYQTLINNLRSNQSSNQASKQLPNQSSSNQVLNNNKTSNKRRKPLTRSQIERIDRSTNQSHGKSNQSHEKSQHQSVYKKGEYLDEGDIVSVKFPEITSISSQNVYNAQLQKAKKMLLSTFLTPENQTSMSEIERQIDEELDREFTDLDNIDFNNLDLDTIRTRIIEKREAISSKQTGKGGEYPTEANYQDKTTDQSKQNKKTVKSELEDIYYQPNTKPSVSKTDQKKPFGTTRCMIED